MGKGLIAVRAAKQIVKQISKSKTAAEILKELPKETKFKSSVLARNFEEIFKNKAFENAGRKDLQKIYDELYLKKLNSTLDDSEKQLIARLFTSIKTDSSGLTQIQKAIKSGIRGSELKTVSKDVESLQLKKKTSR